MRAGSIELDKLRSREALFRSMVSEQLRRSERALVLVAQGAFVGGINTRTMEGALDAMLIVFRSESQTTMIASFPTPR